FLFDQKIAHRSDIHEKSNFHNLFLDWVEQEPKKIQISQPKLHANAEKIVVCHLFPSGTRSYQKEWPRESWLELFRHLQNENYKVVLTGSPSDQARLEQLFSLQDLKGIQVQVGKCSLEETKNLLAQASLVISVNTGIMHLAASLDAPMIALHGPTDPRRWGPVSSASLVLQSQLPCSPCLNLGFEYACPRNDCMKNITVSQVLKAVHQLSSKPS
ncbi:MAG: glycosyltransferase family 9 protein, partial [Pseudobdellovibrionaceae bacterium]